MDCLQDKSPYDMGGRELFLRMPLDDSAAQGWGDWYGRKLLLWREMLSTLHPEGGCTQQFERTVD